MTRFRPARPRLDSAQRRRLLKAFAATGILAAVERNIALAQTAADYKALVCIFLNGGNDGENTLIRYDTAGYANYAAIRSSASGLNIPQAQLLPIQPAGSLTPFGFHPACAPLQALFAQRKLAVVANMGILAAPVTKPGLETGGAPRPSNLFSHSDQTAGIQTADFTAFSRVGWGGRLADKVEGRNPGTLFPPMVSTAGLRTFAAGQTSVPLTVPPNAYFALSPSGDNQFQFDSLRDAAMREILLLGRSNSYDIAAQLYSEEGIAASSVVLPLLQNPVSAVSPLFQGLNSHVAAQMRTIAQLIEGRAQTGMRRQVFFVDQGGYDTHGSQVSIHGLLLGDLAQAIAAFQSAMTALGLAGNVTTFTLSDFGRSFKPASSFGTDHGWGNYAFVVGGAVRGGDFYGTVPTLALNGPDDFGKEGRWIPTTSLEQYGATLARWFDIAESDLPYIFPNMATFPQADMGFMA